MTAGTTKRLAVILLCVSFSVSLAYQMRQSAPGRMLMVDFGGVYYGARSALHHIDPYDPNAVLQEFELEGGRFLPDPTAAKESRYAVTWDVYLPSALFVVIPFAMLPWAVAQNLWIFFTAALLALAAMLMLDLGGRAGSLLACCLAGFLLANCELLFKVGTVAGVAVSLCAVGAWCFLNRRYEVAGVLLFAIGLLLKPHDAGFLWLFFLLSRGAMRKRALQALAVTALLGLCSALWVARSSPHWTAELHSNLQTVSLRGGTSDPGPTGLTGRGIVPIVSLQSSLSIFDNNPHFYNPVSYLAGGLLLLAWAIAVLRKPFSREGAILSLAAVSVLTLLPIYHRTYDAKLLLFTIPACALLWTAKHRRRWTALTLTAAGIFFTSDLPILLSLMLGGNLAKNPPALTGKILNLALLRPAPIILLVLGCFYLWVYARHNHSQPEQSQPGYPSSNPVGIGNVAATTSSTRDCRPADASACLQAEL